MSHTFGTSARLPATATTTTANPATFTINCPSGTTVLWLGIVVSTTTARAGGDPTYNGVAMTAASAKTDAGGTPETNAETWYMLDPPTGSSLTISVPNSGGRAMTLSAACASAASGYTSKLAGSVQTPGNSTNPSTTSSTGAIGDIWFAVIGDGATTWNPSGRSGTQINDWDAGSRGHGAQYRIATATTGETVSWTFGTSEDWIIEVDRFTEQIIVGCTVGNASAAGTTAGINQAMNIVCTVGDAVAAGATASVNQAMNIACTLGDAVATGTSAGINQAMNIVCTLGDAVAAGTTADINAATSVACSPGDAVAAGVTADITLVSPGVPISIDCSVGDAVAAGVAAGVELSAIDVRVSWAEFDTVAATCDVRVSWAEFDTAAATCDVRVSWCEFDTAAVPATDARSAWLRTLFSIEGFAEACREAKRGAVDVLLAREMLEQAKGEQIRLPEKRGTPFPRKGIPISTEWEYPFPEAASQPKARAPDPLFQGLEEYLAQVRQFCRDAEQHKEQQFIKRRRRIHAAALLLA